LLRFTALIVRYAEYSIARNRTRFVTGALHTFSHGPRYACALLTRLRIGTCSLNFSLSTRNLVDSPSCSCGSRCESVAHYLLYCPNYNQLRISLLCNLHDLVSSTLDLKTLSDPALAQLLHRGSPSFSKETNSNIMIFLICSLSPTVETCYVSPCGGLPDMAHMQTNKIVATISPSLRSWREADKYNESQTHPPPALWEKVMIVFEPPSSSFFLNCKNRFCSRIRE